MVDVNFEYALIYAPNKSRLNVRFHHYSTLAFGIVFLVSVYISSDAKEQLGFMDVSEPCRA